MKQKIIYRAILIFIFLAVFFNQPVEAQSGSGPVILLRSEGAITPILVDYIKRGIEIAEEKDASLIILELDTPGGSTDIMNKIVQQIRGSDIPFVVYVYPQNAMAASAGTVITLAGHIAAMAPETTIGAASPVGSQGEDIGETMESKLKEVIKASVRTLTQYRDPEAIKLAESMIDDARAVTVDEALEIGLIDIKAADLNDLLQQLNGRTIPLKEKEIYLETGSVLIVEVNYTLIEEIMLLLVNPNLVFLLLSIGIQAILIEMSNPGGWVAGFIGVVCILLAIYGLGLLPVNWFGLLFMLVAFVLFILEIKAPTHGALSVAGIISFITGALVLFNSVRVPGFPGVSVPLVIGTGIFIAGAFMLIVGAALRAQRKPIQVGRETLPGKTGLSETELNPRGIVHVAGEQWAAELIPGQETLPPNTRIEVVEIQGLRLIVKKAE